MSCETDNCAIAWESVWRKARKEHRCCACNETIRRGDQYRHSSGVWSDSGPDAFKHCVRCWEMLRVLSEKQNGDPNDGSDIDLQLNCGHTWLENFGAHPPDDVAALAFLTPDEMQQRLRTPPARDTGER